MRLLFCCVVLAVRLVLACQAPELELPHADNVGDEEQIELGGGAASDQTAAPGMPPPSNTNTSTQAQLGNENGGAGSNGQTLDSDDSAYTYHSGVVYYASTSEGEFASVKVQVSQYGASRLGLQLVFTATRVINFNETCIKSVPRRGGCKIRRTSYPKLLVDLPAEDYTVGVHDAKETFRKLHRRAVQRGDTKLY